MVWSAGTVKTSVAFTITTVSSSLPNVAFDLIVVVAGGIALEHESFVRGVDLKSRNRGDEPERQQEKDQGRGTGTPDAPNQESLDEALHRDTIAL